MWSASSLSWIWVIFILYKWKLITYSPCSLQTPSSPPSSNAGCAPQASPPHVSSVSSALLRFLCSWTLDRLRCRHSPIFRRSPCLWSGSQTQWFRRRGSRTPQPVSSPSPLQSACPGFSSSRSLFWCRLSVLIKGSVDVPVPFPVSSSGLVH